MRSLLFSFLLLPHFVLAQAPPVREPIGFAAGAREAQARAERVFLDTPTPDRARRWLAALTEDPHVAGTPAEKKVADYVLARFKEFGLDAEMVRYDVFLNHPKHVSLKLVAPVEEELKLREEPYDVDKDSSPEGMFPAFHGYGASGHAPMVRSSTSNYGSPGGLRAPARHGHLGRGQDHARSLRRRVPRPQGQGIAGSRRRRRADLLRPAQTTATCAGDVYPDGPMRPPSAIQRGSVLFLSHVPGDPSTPGWPSTAGAKRLTREQMTNVPKIPSLPDRYARSGEDPAPSRRTARARRVAGRPAVFVSRRSRRRRASRWTCRWTKASSRSTTSSRRIKGSVEPEKLVVLGNHRDAWTHGAVDPNSGTAAHARDGARRSARRSRAAGRRSARSSSRAGTPRSTASSARPSGPRSTPPICRRTPSPISTAMSRSPARTSG